MKHWRYETAQDLDQSTLERLKKFPREPDILVYSLRSAAAIFIRFWLKIYHRFEITGREHLPNHGSFVLVCNHSSHLDALCLTASLPLRKLHRAFPAAAEDYFFKNIPRIWFASVIINALPFSRQTHIKESMAHCHRLLENNNILMIFPEGTRSANGNIATFKPGIGNLLAGTTIPVIPCHLHGAHAAWNRQQILPRPRKLHLVIGSPRCYQSIPAGRDGAHTVAAELELAVRNLANHHDCH